MRSSTCSDRLDAPVLWLDDRPLLGELDYPAEHEAGPGLGHPDLVPVLHPPALKIAPKVSSCQQLVAVVSSYQKFYCPFT